MNEEYVPPTLTVDGVVLKLINDELNVLLIRRAKEPFKDKWALPGGYNPKGETTLGALKRIMHNKAGVNLDKLEHVEQLYTFDTVARDPRGHAVSVTYLGLGRFVEPERTATTEQPTFFPINSLPELVYDHDDIVKYAQERLGSKITYTNAVFALLPELFTLTQLQKAYEAIFGRELDKRNFRRKFLAMDMIDETNKKFADGAHRPARLYRFKDQTLQSLTQTFD